MKNYKILIVSIFFLLEFSIIQLFSANDKKADEILKKADENLMPSSFETYRKLINEEPDGSKKEFIFYSIKKDRDKVAMLYLSPASEKGRAALRLGDNMWLYIPNSIILKSTMQVFLNKTMKNMFLI